MIDPITLVLGLACGVGLGGLIAWLWAASRTRAEAQRDLLQSTERAQRAESVEAELRRQVEAANESLRQLR